MGSEALLPTDPTERRRLQNRIAQRRFRQKKQLARGVDRTADRADRSTTNGGSTTTDRPLEFALPDNFSLGTVPADQGLQDLGVDLETLDNFLENYNPGQPLDARPFSFSTTAPSTDTEPNHLRDAMLPTPRNAVHESLGTDKEKGWLSAMHIAAQKGHERILRVLLEQGNMDPNSGDSDGRTPIFYAAVGGHNSVVRLLLSHGSRVSHLDNDRRTVLHWTAHYQHLEVLRTLLEHWSEHEQASCDINAYDNHGWTPLHLAVERGFEDGVLLLIQWGADMNAKARKCWMTDLKQLTD
ncbi:ankyrin repeat-containing domain protein [Aspergillus undulatus]|uniref:ankyrin repeat-containing domain protein n=1 Tax=Aspergillus undulatus TaxID=1810928 RepID=UPI003CCD529B